MSQTDCPTRDRISKYLLGMLEEDESERVADHVAGCHQCQEVANELDAISDPLIDILRGPVPQSPYVDEPQCRGASERLIIMRRRFPWAFQPGDEQSDSEDDWELPQILGDYLVIRRVGGHQGAVYEAIHMKLDRRVVLKMLPADLLDDQAAAERFQREIKALGRLNHPNVVHASDAREVGGRWFLVMEYVDGCDLAELVRCHGRLPIAEACELARQAAVGLQYICQHGLVHRDVKPANLMLTRDGQVKLLDLGLACFRRVQQAPAGEATGPEVAVGTVDYMAPEQISDSRHVDIRADIYSLGCTLYKLLAGRAPFETPECDTVPAKLAAHLQRRATPIQQLRSDIPAGLAAVLGRMLAKNPAERFDTPEQVAAALKPFAAGADLPALLAGPEPGTPAEKQAADVPSRCSTRWFWEIVVAAGVLLLLAFVAKMGIDDFGLVWSRAVSGRVTHLESPAAHSQPADEVSRPYEAGIPATQPAPSQAAGQAPPQGSTAVAEPSTSSSSPTEQPGQLGSSSAADPAAFAVQLALDHADHVYSGPPAGPDGKGEPIRVTITSERSGYLYLLNRQADGTLICLFPNVYQPNNKIEAGQPVTVPETQGDFELRAGPPYGTEVLVALVTEMSLPPSKFFGVASLTDRQFTVVDRQAVEQLRTQMKQNPRAQAIGAGAEAQVELTIRPGGSQESQAPQAKPESPGDAVQATPSPSEEAEDALLPSDEPAESMPPSGQPAESAPQPRVEPEAARPSEKNKPRHSAGGPSTLASTLQTGAACGFQRVCAAPAARPVWTIGVKPRRQIRLLQHRV